MNSTFEYDGDMKGLFGPEGKLSAKKAGDLLTPEEFEIVLEYLNSARVAWDIFWTESVSLSRRKMDLVTGDYSYVLRHGYCVHSGQETTVPGLYKYLVVSKAPSGQGSPLGLLVIPDLWKPSMNPAIKVCELYNMDGVKRYIEEHQGVVRENPVSF